jgi:predicted transcriptional regulator
MLPNLNEIKIMRKALNLTQQDLSELTNISRSTITKIELGKLDPSFSKVKKIFEKLDLQEKIKGIKNKLENITLEDIHVTSIEYATASQSIHDTHIRMLETAFSQFPVKSNGNIVGSISERAISKAIFENAGEDIREQPISKIMEDPFPILSASTPLNLVDSLIMHEEVVLTQKDNSIVGIVTNVDIGKVLEIMKP